MRFKIEILLIIALYNLNLNAQSATKNRVTGIFTQQLFYRFTIVEFNDDMTFKYHIMSERAHRQTTGEYDINGDTIVLNSYSTDTYFDFINEKWLICSRNKIIKTNSFNNKKERWAILIRNKQYDSIPTQQSNFAIKIDSLKLKELSWIDDTTNYDVELKLIIHEPGPSNEPITVIDNIPIKYDFFLNYYDLVDIESINVIKGDKYSNVYGWRASQGILFVKTRKPKR